MCGYINNILGAAFTFYFVKEIPEVKNKNRLFLDI